MDHYRIILAGLLLTILIFTSCQPKSEESAISNERTVISEDEKFRPAYHFTPPSQWMNDPNGMVYHEGEYHLFYQHYPDSNVWGPMHWGHAVSRDMMHWQHLPIALFPDSLGYIYSGSAVVDRNNTSGFGSEDHSPMVAIYTYHDPVGEKNGTLTYETQGLAYSLDQGRTWTKYEGNPVLLNPGIKDFRDPKVSWMAEFNKWVMILAVKDHVEIYSSGDLKTWTKESEFGKDVGAHGGVWECPDLFRLTDQHGTEKWVILLSINPGGPQGGSATQYFMGDFDGKTFTPDDEVTRWLDFGADNYAGVTWNNVPEEDGRRLFIGWMSNWQYANRVPTREWRSAMTLPRELELIKYSTGHELISKPVREVKDLFSNPESFNGQVKAEHPIWMLAADVDEAESLHIKLSNERNEEVVIRTENHTLILDRTKSGMTGFHEEFGAVHAMDISGIPVDQIAVYLDRSSIEIFVNDGRRVMTDLLFPNEPLVNIETRGLINSELSYLEKAD